MKWIFNNKIAVLFGSCFLLLSACDSSGSGVRTSSVSTTSTPAMLRAIPMNELTAIVTVDGSTTSYFGRDFADNNWIIYLHIEPAKEYPITIKWFASNNVLLMIQEGTVFGRNTEETAIPQLTSVSEGAGFDYDCDLISNLDETINGSDPGQADAAACIIESKPVDVVALSDIKTPATPNDTLVPVLRQNYELFENVNIPGRVTRFSQSIKVQTTNPNRRAAYRISLSDINSSMSLSIDLLDDPSFGRFARFFNNNAETNVTLLPAVGADVTCTDTRCSTPFDWQEEHWYELIFEEDEMDSTQLRTSVLDPTTQIITQLGTLVIPPNTVWTRPTIVLFYHEQLTAAECTNGLSPATLHYRNGIVNNEFTMSGPIATPPTNCLIWGGGASTSIITGAPQGDIFTLTLGER